MWGSERRLPGMAKPYRPYQLAKCAAPQGHAEQWGILCIYRDIQTHEDMQTDRDFTPPDPREAIAGSAANKGL